MYLQKRRIRDRWLLTLALMATVGAGAACGMAGFGGALELNVTDQQTRQLRVRVDSGTDGLVVELHASGDVELGSGSVEIDRYLLQRSTFGSSRAIGYFLCAKPCTDPLSSYLVAFSPEHIFVASGQLELRFRVVSADGHSEEISRSINAEMLPDLWRTPTIELGFGGS